MLEERRIEVKSMQEGLRLVCRQKLFAMQWIQHEEGSKQEDQYSHIDKVEKQIQKCMEQNFDKQKRDDEDEVLDLLKKRTATPQSSLVIASSATPLNKQSSVYTGGPMVRKKSISGNDVFSRYSSNVGLIDLKHNAHAASESKLFIEQVTKVLKELIEKLNFSKSNAQLRNCVNVLDLFRRSKAIAFVGPVCSGKTTILKIVSNALHVAFKLKLRTSVVNTATMTSKDLYGSIDAFNKHPKTNPHTQTTDNSNDGDFSKSGIFKIILDVFDKERQQANALPEGQERPKLMQSIFFDSCEIDQPLSESLLDFIEKTNKREELSQGSTEYLMDFKLSGEIKAPGMSGDERIPVTLPNGNVIQFPNDLFLFFETTSLKDASPPFISKVGLIVTESDDLTWQCIFKRQLIQFLRKQDQFFADVKFAKASVHIHECAEEFLLPFLEKITSHQRITQCEFFNAKAATLQLFNLLNCVFFKLRDVVKQRIVEEDADYESLLTECERDVLWSNCLLAAIWSFGALLPRELRRQFEEAFSPFKRRFNLNMSTSATAQAAGSRTRFTLFDIYYDPETLQWELLQENIDYKLKLQYDPLSNQLLVPTVEVSQCFFMMDILVGSGPRYDDNVLDNKHFRALGPSGTGKSFAINTFLKRVNGEAKFQLVQVPMSAYVTIERIKETMECLYVNKRRNLLEPRDKERNIVMIIEDVHLQSNLSVNILEFLRTWCMSKGYYDIQQGFFKGIGNFVTVTTENSDYRRSETTKFPGRDPVNSRFLYYTNTIYLDEYDAGGIERIKTFTQQWFTSKLWSTSKLLNKYYILIQNTMLLFVEKLKRIEAMNNSSFLKLTNFHFIQKFCSNLVAYTITKDELPEKQAKGLKEEDIVSNLMIYELMRMYGDRLHRATQKTVMMQKLIECCKQEFIGRSTLTPQDIDQIVLGNYHDRREGACVKYSTVLPSHYPQIKEEIRKKVRSSSNNQFLEGILESPNSVKEIYKISRILFKDMQHLILVGPPGCGKLEYLQLAAILNDALIFELNCSRLCESLKFVEAFKRAVIASVGLNQNTLILISDSQLRDPIYIDFVNNFILNMCNKYETAVLWGDNEFKSALIQVERELYTQSNVKRAAEPTEDQLLVQAMRKMQKNIHIVLMIDDFQTYFEWVSLFPQLEVTCEVSYMDELSSEGYKKLTQNFFMQRGADTALFQDSKLTSALVELRQIVKNNIVNAFYSPTMLKHTCTEELLTNSLTEFIFNSEEKLNGFLYQDGNFKIRDTFHRQSNYNVPVNITVLYQTKYVQFLELFRYLYDFMSLGLVVRRNYYEAFLRKASEFSEFFKDIKVSKKSLHGQSSNLTSRVAAMRDKVSKLIALIEDRERLVTRKRIELKEVQMELQVNQDEVDQATEERDQAIDEILNHFEKVTGSEFIYILSQFTRFTDKEMRLLDLVGVLIEKNAKIEGYSRKDHSPYFSDRDELINLLDERRDFNYDEACFTRIKDFITQCSVVDFKDKPLFKLLFQYFNALYKKLNLRNVMANQYSRIKQFKAQLEQVQFTLNYSENYLHEKKKDLQDVQARYTDLSKQERQLSMKIEEAEISHMRTEHIIEEIEKYSQRMMLKLTKVRKRAETLLGDALILASTVVFLGPFSMKERKQIRKEMAEYLNTTSAGLIKCGNYWTEKGGVNNSKIIRAVLKELGVGSNNTEDQLLSTIPQGILSQETMVETIFSLMFAPSCPLIVDPTGQLQNFLQNNLLTKMQTKVLYASDQGVNNHLEQIMRGSTFALLNDVNDCSDTTYGLSQDESLLTRLAHITHNGFEHDASLLKNSYLQKLLSTHSVHTTHASVNKRLSVTGRNVQLLGNTNEVGSNQTQDIMSFYQVQILSPRFDFTLNSDYMARATVLVAIDDDEVTSTHQMGSNSAWVDIKGMMLKHFLPEECQKLQEIKERIRKLEIHRNDSNKSFENAFLIANQETLQRLSEYSQLKQSVEDIKYYEEEKRELHETFQSVLSSHPLLSSYSNVISILFQSLKKLSKITGVVTYSWKIFMSVVDQILAKAVRELKIKVQSQHQTNNQQSSTSIIIDSQGRLALRSTKQLPSSPQPSHLDFTLDEEFFSTQVIPHIYGAVASSFKSDLVPLFNLIFAIKLAFKKREITEAEVDYFFKQLFMLKHFENWRDIETNLVHPDERVEKSKFLTFKRELIKIYPEHGRKIVDLIEKDITQSFLYKQASHTLNFKIFSNDSEYSKLKLFQKINIGFLSPDHEFKTKLIQLVYEQLSSVFNFSEIPIKLHEFVRMASWTQPIAIIPQSRINTISSICSVASYYGISLEILRSSDLPKTDGDTAQERANENVELKWQIQSQLNDYTHGADSTIFTNDAAVYKRDSYIRVTHDDKLKNSVLLSKVNVENMQNKELIRADEKSIMGAQEGQNPLGVIERSAKNGTWVFISSLRFPTYWRKMIDLLDELRESNSIKSTFRLFIDLQGYSQNEIPDSFLFDNSLSFYLTEKNNSEQLEQVHDVWSSLLNPQILSELTEYKPYFAEDVKQILSVAVKEEMSNALKSMEGFKQSATVTKSGGAQSTTVKNNVKYHQDQHIKDDKQRELYSQYMVHMQPFAENQANSFKEQIKDHDEFLAGIHQVTESSHNNTMSLVAQSIAMNSDKNSSNLANSIGLVNQASPTQKGKEDQVVPLQKQKKSESEVKLELENSP